jgi:hypothetical protein
LGLPENGNWAVGQTLQLTDGRSGRLTEIARGETGFEALAVLNLEPGAAEAPQTPAPTGIAATELPLPYSLE